MKNKPTFDRLLIRRGKKPTETKEGIHIPDQAKDTVRDAVVIAVGPDVKYVKPGDKIFTALRPGTPVEIEDETLYIILESDAFLVR